MAIYCQEHNKSTAHAVSHETGNKSVLLQQMNTRAKEKKTKTNHKTLEKKKKEHQTHTHKNKTSHKTP